MLQLGEITPQFQFTHPGRGATTAGALSAYLLLVSIHAPREGCDFRALECVNACIVSIHAPREGCDILPLSPCIEMSGFNSRTPGGVRLYPRYRYWIQGSRFNSRTPGGVRHYLTPYRINLEMFQFTHPGRGATARGRKTSGKKLLFQFTHPGRGATDTEGGQLRGFAFQFTHPGRGAT